MFNFSSSKFIAKNIGYFRIGIWVDVVRINVALLRFENGLLVLDRACKIIFTYFR